MKGAIFDTDGLLLDSERLYQSCWHQLARDRGLTLPSDFAVRITGSGPKQAHLVLRSCYPDDDPDKQPVCRWRSGANLLFGNWLDYFVYQETPYVVEDVGNMG